MTMTAEREIENYHRTQLDKLFQRYSQKSTREIEAELLARIEAGDQSAKAELFMRNERNARAVVAKFAEPGTLLFEDLLCRSFIGMEKALAAYRPDLDRHQTFSSWCRNYVKDECVYVYRRIKNDVPLLETHESLSDDEPPDTTLPDFSLCFPGSAPELIAEVIELIAEGFGRIEIRERTGASFALQMRVRTKLKEYYS